MSEGHGIRVVVDRSVCVGSGPCFVVAPHTFALDDSMKAVVLNPGLDAEDQLFEAARTCPTQAIFLARGDAALYPSSTRTTGGHRVATPKDH